MDFASDDKRTKRTARVMLAMTNDINVRLAAAIHKPEGERTRVQCATCHRGIPNPQLLPDLLRQTMLTKGEGAAVVQYRELRQQYLDTPSYDFRESVLLDLGRESLAAKKADDALAWLQMNVEFYPKSVASYVELARAHMAKRDKDSALAVLDKALALDPANTDVSSAVVAASTATVERFLRRVIGPPRSGRRAPAGARTGWCGFTHVLGRTVGALERVTAILRPA